MTSPLCTVNSTATTNGVDVTGGSTVTIQLANLAGVKQWSIQCLTTDELNSPTTITAGLSINQTTKTATFTAPASACALRFQSQVNVGLTNGVADPTLTTTFCVYVQTASGLRLGAFNETTEGSAANGWGAKFNALIRAMIGNAGGWLALGAISAPGTPAAGAVRVYLDTADKRLKGIDQNGTVFPMDGGWLTFNAWALVTANYTAHPCELAMVDATSSGPLISLPDATKCVGRRIRVYDSKGQAAGHNIGITPTGGQTVDGTVFVAISQANHGYTVISDGANWHTEAIF